MASSAACHAADPPSLRGQGREGGRPTTSASLSPPNPNPKSCPTPATAARRRHARSRFRPPELTPTPPPDAPCSPRSPRRRNRRGTPKIDASVPVISASGRRTSTRSPLPPTTPALAVTCNALLVSSRSARIPSCAPYPFPHRSHRTPRSAAATMVAGATPATIWSVAPPPLAPLHSL